MPLINLTQTERKWLFNKVAQEAMHLASRLDEARVRQEPDAQIKHLRRALLKRKRIMQKLKEAV